jgi:1,4-alpha-glucan branching enzyme
MFKSPYEVDFDPSVSFIQKGKDPNDVTLFVCNSTPVPRSNCRVGVPFDGEWREVQNGDALLYGGSGQGNMGGITASPLPVHGRPYSLNMTLPPLGAVVLRPGR